MRKLKIATGRSRRDTRWRNRNVNWDTLVEKLTTCHRTHETVKEYQQMSGDRKNEIKDVGGFVAGFVKGGRRKAANITLRSAVTLDLDFAPYDFWDLFTTVFGGVEACLYSTHSHTSDTPRYRLIMPLSRDATPDEYEAVARKVAEIIGIDFFDDTTFEPARLMYYPSTPKDGDWIGVRQTGEWLNVDEVLSSYTVWTDRSSWAVSSRTEKVRERSMKRLGEPTEKAGVIGAFCRQYSVSEAISEFLSDIYDPTDLPNRYTFAGGTSAGGLVVYNDLFAYSHHSSDPCCGKAVNAFDLVRIHKFGDLDEESKEDTPVNRLPSFRAMQDFAKDLPAVKELIIRERLEEVEQDFSTPLDESTERSSDGQCEVEESEPDLSWTSQLNVSSKGVVEQTISNVELVLNNDPKLKGVFAFNEFERREVAVKDLMWRKVTKLNAAITDADDSQLRGYLEKVYNLTNRNCIADGLTNVIHNNRFHPVREYLDSLEWDGVERIERLLPDYMGSDDSEYTKTVMRKVMVAAVSRIYKPGCKFDYMLTLVGRQGTGKSTFVSKLGKDWYSDSFGTIQGKEAYESIQGVWLMEMGELAALRKAEIEPIKHFISKQTDRYRVAYGRRTEEFPRQCIFIGTTNDQNFLKDPTGNRRFWVVEVGVEKPIKRIWDLTEAEIDLLWAEAVHLYKAGESRFLNAEMEKEAYRRQKEHFIYYETVPLIKEFLDVPILPEDEWDKLELYQKQDVIRQSDLTRKGTVRRDKVTAMEIWTECLGGTFTNLSNTQTKEIRDIMSNMEGWIYKKFRKGNRTLNGYIRVLNVPAE